MNTAVKLTVLFKDPFWIGIFEEEEKGIYKVCKVTFGAEPKEGDVLEYILKKFYKLNFSSSKTDNQKIIEKKENPKKLQREINRELKKKTIGTKAQIALTEAYEENKIERKKKSKVYKEMEKERQFKIKQIKKKEKHKGH